MQIKSEIKVACSYTNIADLVLGISVFPNQVAIGLAGISGRGTKRYDKGSKLILQNEPGSTVYMFLLRQSLSPHVRCLPESYSKH